MKYLINIKQLMVGYLLTKAPFLSRKKNKSMPYNRYTSPEYPPFLKGIPSVDSNAIVDSQQEILNKIKFEIGEEQYAMYLSIIENYANFVHLLPASEKHHHRGAGGLFHHGLSVGYNSLLYAKGKIFDSSRPPSEREANSKKWLLAAFIAGIGHDLGKPLTDYLVVSKDTRVKWNPYTQTLQDWLNENNLNEYFLNWRENRYRKHESLSTFLAERIIDKKILSYLEVDDNLIIRSMLDCISNQVAHDNPLFDVVEKADHKSVEMDIKNTKITEDDVNLSVPIEKYILDSIKYLTIKREWGIDFNLTPPILIVEDNVYLTAKAIERICSRLESIKVPGVPWHKKAITISLIENGLAEARLLDNAEKSNVWPVYKEGSDKTIWAVKIKEWSVIYSVQPEITKGYSLKLNKVDKIVHNVNDKSDLHYKDTEIQLDLPPPLDDVPLIESYEDYFDANESISVSEAPVKSDPSGDEGSFIKEAIKLKAFFVHDDRIALDWQSMPEKFKNTNYLSVLTEQKLIKQGVNGVTHLIDNKACLILTDKAEELESIKSHVKQLKEIKKKSLPSKKVARESENIASPAMTIEQKFKKAFLRHKGRISGRGIIEMSVLAKKYHSKNFIKQIVESGLVIEEPWDLSDKLLISLLKIKLTKKALSILSVEQIKERPAPAKKLTVIKPTIEIPKDFKPSKPQQSNNTKNVEKRINSDANLGDNKATIANVFRDPLIVSICDRTPSLEGVIRDRLQGKINQSEMLTAMKKLGLEDFDIGMIKREIN